MDKNYEIDLRYENGYSKIESCFGLNLHVVENMHDTGIESYYFDSDYVIAKAKEKEEKNWAINYLLLEIYNGTRIACNLKPFKPFYTNSNIKTIHNQIFAYRRINAISLEDLEYTSTDSEFKITLRIAMINKTIRDMLILLNRVSNLDESTLINYYKIFDFVNTYIDLVEKYRNQILNSTVNIGVIQDIKNTYYDLKNELKKLKTFKRVTNNYLSVGLVSRHGLQSQTPKEQEMNYDEIFYSCLNSVRYLIKMNYLSNCFNFDALVKIDLENKNH